MVLVYGTIFGLALWCIFGGPLGGPEGQVEAAQWPPQKVIIEGCPTGHLTVNTQQN